MEKCPLKKICHPQKYDREKCPLKKICHPQFII
jgi:hypothetical protein